MATHASAEKAARQSERRRARNTAAQSRIKTTIKNFRTAISNTKVSGTEAKKILVPLLNEAQSVLMKAASKNLIKKGTASRYIARLSAAVDKASA